jgi:gamma-glutamyl phosphate reductase
VQAGDPVDLRSGLNLISEAAADNEAVHEVERSNLESTEAEEGAVAMLSNHRNHMLNIRKALKTKMCLQMLHPRVRPH